MEDFNLVRHIATYRIRKGLPEEIVQGIVSSSAQLHDEIPALLAFAIDSSNFNGESVCVGWTAVATNKSAISRALSHPRLARLQVELEEISHEHMHVDVEFSAESESWLPMVRDIWTELTNIVSPNHTVLVIIDVQNDYCIKGGARATEGLLSGVAAFRQPLIDLIESARNAAVPVVYTMTQNNEDHDHGPVIARRQRVGLEDVTYTIPGTWGWQICDFVEPWPADHLIPKWRHSAFTNPVMDSVLRGLNAKSLVVTGVVTNGCVEGTVRDAFAKGFYVTVLEDCVAGSDINLHRYSLANMAQHFALISTSAAVREIWDHASIKPGSTVEPG